MTVEQMIIHLHKEDPDAIVVVSSDPEGNNYSELSGWGDASYDKESKEIGLLELTEELEAEGYSEEDLKPNGVKAIVIYPK